MPSNFWGHAGAHGCHRRPQSQHLARQEGEGPREPLGPVGRPLVGM